jgi:hypothetical protein
MDDPAMEALMLWWLISGANALSPTGRNDNAATRHSVANLLPSGTLCQFILHHFAFRLHQLAVFV